MRRKRRIELEQLQSIDFEDNIEGLGCARLFMCFNNPLKAAKKNYINFLLAFNVFSYNLVRVYWSFLNELTSFGNLIIQCNTAYRSFHPLNFPLPRE